MAKRFSLAEAESLIPEVSRLLREAVSLKGEYQDAELAIQSWTRRITMMGGINVDRGQAIDTRKRRDASAASLRSAIEQVQAMGCVVKDLDVGLLDFPARIDDQEVYLCWKLGEDRIRFYHALDEGFAARKPIDPRDAGYNNPVQ